MCLFYGAHTKGRTSSDDNSRSAAVGSVSAGMSMRPRQW